MKDFAYKSDSYKRFELFPNQTEPIDKENSFNIYLILIALAVVGGIVMFYGFDLKGTSFLMTYTLLMLVLVNILIFYKRMAKRRTVYKLILDKKYIQLIHEDSIEFQERLKDISIIRLRYGEGNFPVIQIHNKVFQSISIGIKANIPIQDYDVIDPKSQPDYWVSYKKEWKRLLRTLQLE